MIDNIILYIYICMYIYIHIYILDVLYTMIETESATDLEISECSAQNSAVPCNFFAVDGLAETQPPGSKHYKHSRCEVVFETKLVCLRI